MIESWCIQIFHWLTFVVVVICNCFYSVDAEYSNCVVALDFTYVLCKKLQYCQSAQLLYSIECL